MHGISANEDGKASLWTPSTVRKAKNKLSYKKWMGYVVFLLTQLVEHADRTQQSPRAHESEHLHIDGSNTYRHRDRG